MMDREFLDYQGVRLVAPEARVLEELEEWLRHLIYPVAEFTEQITLFGFITESNHVNEIAFDAQQLSSLPASLGILCHLRLLSLAFNQLRSLPKSIGQLQSLQELNL